ncbi:MAG: hypothetical protein IPF41_15820 [Flavobacteriales bacterium]|nr:hypothetical protein [Flavobacteriales bacterium]
MPAFALSSTFPPAQKLVIPPAVIVAVGAVLTVTVVAALVELQAPLVTNGIAPRR